jgi:ubiquinol-cytochrome c reductase cytochrome c subunit
MQRTSTIHSTPLRIVTLALATVAAALFSFHVALAQTTPAAAPAPAGDAARGKADFLRYGCYECHGTVGEGNYGSGAKLAPHPLPWAVVNAYVRKPSGNMPSFSEKILATSDLADIYAYLSSIPAGKPYTQIPILNATTMKPK